MERSNCSTLPLRAVTDDQRAELLEGAARRGGELLGFGVDGVPATVPVPSFSTFHGLYWLCVNLAAGSALALLVDDAHWLDEPSLGWIEYLSPAGSKGSRSSLRWPRDRRRSSASAWRGRRSKSAGTSLSCAHCLGRRYTL